MIDKQSAVPLYVQLKRLIEEQVAYGALSPHSRIPSERELSEQFEISRMTARRALTELTREGLIYTSAGKGTFVAEPKINQSLQALTSFTEDMRVRGMQPSTRLVRCELIAAPELVAAKLRISPATRVLCVERLRLADGEAMALEAAHFAFAGMERMLTLDLEGSLYALLHDEFGLTPTEAVQEFEARLATHRECLLLQLSDGMPVLKLERTTFDAEQRPFEYVQSVYRSDRYRFVARLVREGAR
jgi:GntR family transcriptional regulator